MSKDVKQAVGIRRMEGGHYETKDGERIIPGVNGSHITIGVRDKITKTLDESLVERNADPFYPATIGKGRDQNNLITILPTDPSENPFQGATTMEELVKAAGGEVMKEVSFQYGVPVINKRYLSNDMDIAQAPESPMHAKYIFEELVRDQHEFKKITNEKGQTIYLTKLEFRDDTAPKKSTRNPEYLALHEKDMSALTIYLNRLKQEKYDTVKKNTENTATPSQEHVVPSSTSSSKDAQKAEQPIAFPSASSKVEKKVQENSQIQAPHITPSQSTPVFSASLSKKEHLFFDKFSKNVRSEILDPVLGELSKINFATFTKEKKDTYVKNIVNVRQRVMMKFFLDATQLVARNKGKEVKIFSWLFDRFKEKIVGLFPSLQKNTLVAFIDKHKGELWTGIEGAITRATHTYSNLEHIPTKQAASLSQPTRKADNVVFIDGVRQVRREKKVIDFHERKAAIETAREKQHAQDTQTKNDNIIQFPSKTEETKKTSFFKGMYNKVTSFFGRNAA